MSEPGSTVDAEPLGGGPPLHMDWVGHIAPLPEDWRGEGLLLISEIKHVFFCVVHPIALLAMPRCETWDLTALLLKIHYAYDQVCTQEVS
jgi:hypothetical protein